MKYIITEENHLIIMDDKTNDRVMANAMWEFLVDKPVAGGGVSLKASEEGYINAYVRGELPEVGVRARLEDEKFIEKHINN